MKSCHYFLLLIALFGGPQWAQAQVAVPGIELIRSNGELLPPLESSSTSRKVEPANLPRAPKMESIQAYSQRTAGPSPFRQVDNNDDEELKTAGVESPKPLPPHMQRLQAKLLQVLSMQMKKPRYTTRHSPWGIMHAMHAFGVETQVSTGNQMVNAAGWLAWNKPCRNRTMMYLDSRQNLQLRIGPGYQGHEGQFLALLAQARVKEDFELKVDGKTFTVADLVDYEQRTCKPGTELTFKLIGLSHYCGPRAEWRNQYGAWNIPRLIEEELRQPVVGAACGGTHRLFGHSYALDRARKKQVEISGTWKRATQYTLNYQKRAIMLRNRDGSFSTQWFEGRGMSSDIDRRLQTTGHILEWMVFSLPEVDLQDPRIIQSVDYLATLMWNHRHHDWEIGPRGHAIRALALYDQRVFGGSPGKLNQRLAELVPGHPLR